MHEVRAALSQHKPVVVAELPEALGEVKLPTNPSAIRDFIYWIKSRW